MILKVPLIATVALELEIPVKSHVEDGSIEMYSLINSYLDDNEDQLKTADWDIQEIIVGRPFLSQS